MWQGRLNEALNEVSRARELDPLSLVINTNLGYVLAGARQYEQAIEQCRKVLDMDPNFALAHYRLGQFHILTDAYTEAIPELDRAIALSGGSPRASAEMGLAYARLGNTRAATKLIDDLREQSTRRYVSPFDLAVIYGGLGNRDRALEWLEKAYEERSPSLSLLQFSPAFATIRSSPRFTNLVRRVGLPS
jgi:tetratricopeptide (TPR) repeat protein